MRAGDASLPALVVLRLVVRPERGVVLLDRPPPPLVLAVPVDHLAQADLELDLWRPAETAQLRRIEAVPTIVPGSIGDRLDQRQRLAELRQDAMREVHVHHVVAAADVVDLAV